MDDWEQEFQDYEEEGSDHEDTVSREDSLQEGKSESLGRVDDESELVANPLNDTVNDPELLIEWGLDDNASALNRETLRESSKVVNEAARTGIGDDKLRNAVTVQKSEEDIKEEKARNRRRAIKKKHRLEITHLTELLVYLARAVYVNTQCDDVSGVWHAARLIMPAPFTYIASVAKLDLLLDWFSKEFQLTSSCCSSSETNIYDAMMDRKGNKMQLLQVFVAMCRSVGISCRLCAALQPSLLNGSYLQKKPGSEICAFWAEVLVGDLTASSNMPSTSPVKTVVSEGNTSRHDELDVDSDDKSILSRSLRWIYVPPFDGKKWRRTNPPSVGVEIPYIVGLGVGNFAVDITAKYATRWTRTIKYRHDETNGWWHIEILSMLQASGRNWLKNNSALQSLLEKEEINRISVSFSERLLADETALMERIKNSEAMPTSLDGFRLHPRYFVSTQLTKFQALLPGSEKAGVFKGFDVYLKKDVYNVKSERQWIKLARVVREEEKEKPLKFVSSSKGWDMNLQCAAGTYDEENERNSADLEIDGETAENERTGEHREEKIPLYARWQTEDYIPPEVGDDGCIPTSSFGNVELWTPKHLPKGAAHLKGRFATEAALKLGIHYAAALVGFESRNGRHVPRFDGVVVAQKFSGMVSDAAEMMLQSHLEKENEKRVLSIFKKWKKLCNAVLVQHRVKSSYERESSSPATRKQENTKKKSSFGLVCDHEFKATKRKLESGEERECHRCGMRKIVEKL